MGGRKASVLAVDDDESMLELYREQLPLLGYRVRCAFSAEDARKLIEEEAPDIIMMDLMMTGEDGLSLTRELKGSRRTAGIPILVVSALRDAGALGDAMLSGADDFLTKPFELDVLKTKLQRAAGRAREG